MLTSKPLKASMRPFISFSSSAMANFTSALVLKLPSSYIEASMMLLPGILLAPPNRKEDGACALRAVCPVRIEEIDLASLAWCHAGV